MRAYHFVNKTLRDGREIPPDGEWLEETGDLRICHKGLHASLHVSDAIALAAGTMLCLVELDGIADQQKDKVVAARRKIIARFDATDLLRADARASALSVIHLWDAPAVVKQYLETGDESIRVETRKAAYAVHAAWAAYAAYDAASSAASSAAYFAAYDAASSAAYDAAYDAASAAASSAAAVHDYAARQQHVQSSRDRVQSAVDAKFKQLGVN
jgi:hypothetical protein